MLSLNMQPAEKQDVRPDGSLEVFKAWKTLQGEGPHAGKPAVFVRMAGCDLQCPACDTDYTSSRDVYEPEALAYLVRQLAGETTRLIVLTGGEPFRQNIGPVVHELLHTHDVQIETNGTLYLEGFPYGDFGLDIVCSPKTGQVNKRLKPHITHLKYVLAAGKVDPDDGLPTDSLGAGVRVARPWPGVEVYVQPLDEGDVVKNSEHEQAAVESCLTYGYRLSFQLHKLLGLE
jgi:7-carboxy-7-deazaguanine synthase